MNKEITVKKIKRCHTAETKRKISESRLKRKERLGYLNSPETRRKMGEARMGHIPWNKGEKMFYYSPRMKGKKHSIETRLKMSQSQKGKKRSDKTKEIIRISKLGSKIPDCVKVKISNTLKKYFKTHKPHNYKEGNYNTKEYRSMIENRRRVRKANNGGFFTLNEWEDLKIQYNWMCPSCKKEEPIIKLTIDHIIPISKGGQDNIKNIQPLCRKCNSAKNNKIIKYDN